VRRWVRGVLLVGSIGLALHLVLPQISGIERSLRLVAGTSHLLVAAAFLAELASELCYAELLEAVNEPLDPIALSVSIV
jgi:hypothetical protein